MTRQSTNTADQDRAAPIGAMSDDDFRTALARIAPHLRGFARSLCGCPDRADDLAQETMMKAWAARGSYKSGTNFKAWMFTIMKNIFINNYRRMVKANTVFDSTDNQYYINSGASQVISTRKRLMPCVATARICSGDM